jgi:hypothetical protein
MGQAEPPSRQPSQPARIFRIGRDSHGHWVAQDQQGLCGGLFVDRAEALRFVRLENGNRPQAVVMVPGVFELDLKGDPRRSSHSGNGATGLRQVA